MANRVTSAVPRLAVDMGGTTTRIALVRGATILERREVPTRAAAGPDAMVAALIDALSPWRASCDEVRVAATGRVHGGHVSAVNTVTLPGWTDVPLARLLTTALGRPVLVVNDAHAAAWGEYRHGSGIGTQDFAFVTVSTGIGAGIVGAGRPLVGARGQAAHLGFLATQGAAFLEAFASGTAIADRAGSAMGAATTTRAVFEAARAGDARAEAVVASAVEALADALVTLRWVVDPQRVAIGGSVGLAERYLDRLRAACDRRPDVRGLELVPARLGADAGLIGAAAWEAPRP